LSLVTDSGAPAASNKTASVDASKANPASQSSEQQSTSSRLAAWFKEMFASHASPPPAPKKEAADHKLFKATFNTELPTAVQAKQKSSPRLVAAREEAPVTPANVYPLPAPQPVAQNAPPPAEQSSWFERLFSKRDAPAEAKTE